METLLHAGLNNALSATLLALVVACLGRLLARRPAVLHCLWFLVLLKLVTPPLYEVSIPVLSSFRAVREESFEPNLASVETTVVLLDHDDKDISPESDRTALAQVCDWLRTDWMRLIGAIWVAGTVMTLLISCWRIHRFQLLLNEAEPASEEIQDWVDELSADLGLGRSPSAWWVSGKLSPMLWALGRSPRLIIPRELWKSLDNRQRATLLVHELAHLRRGDHHVRMFELVVTALYWWNPVLWWVRRALRDVEEQCCDAWVVWAFPDAAKSYAETLLETLDFLHQSDHVEPLLASGFGKVHHLRKRLTMIMNGNTPRSVSSWGALGSLSLAVLLLPFNPSWAQTPDEPKEVQVIVKTVGEPDAPPSEGTATIKSDAQVLVKEVISIVPDMTLLTGVVELFDKASPETVILRTDSLGLVTTDDGKPSVHLEFKVDGSAFVIEADSLKEAIGKLKEQVEALSKKSPQTDLDKKQKEALDKAVKSLVDSAKQIDQANGKIDRKTIVLKQLDGKLQDEKRALIRRLAQDQKLSAEDAARLNEAKAKDLKGVRQVRVVVKEDAGEKLSDDKKKAERTAIRQRVEKLSMEVREKRVELAAAQKRLSELEHEADRKRARPVTVTKGTTPSPVIGVVKPDDPTKRQVQIHVGGGSGATGIVGKPAPSDQKRIDELEKLLQKLLEDVASLKKEKSGEKK